MIYWLWNNILFDAVLNDALNSGKISVAIYTKIVYNKVDIFHVMPDGNVDLDKSEKRRII